MSMFIVHKDGVQILVTDYIFQKETPSLYLVSSCIALLSIFMD